MFSRLYNDDNLLHRRGQEKTPISVRADGNNVVVGYSDRSVEVRSGETRAWRNNNPGNIRNTDFAKRRGSLGKAGGFAVFPNEATGRQAVVDLLSTDTYQSLTINGAINRYAPSIENSTRNYQTLIQNFTGLDGGTILNTLNTQQLNGAANAIGRVEGWRVGTVTFQ